MQRKNPPDFNSMTINQRIASIRKLKGYSQSDLAEAFGIKVSTYSQKERKGIIDCKFLIKFCDYFNIDIRLMLYGEEVVATLKTPIDVPPPQPPKMPEKPIEIEPGIIIGARQKNLLKIFHYFPKSKRELAYKIINELCQTKLKEFLATHPTFSEH